MGSAQQGAAGQAEELQSVSNQACILVGVMAADWAAIGRAQARDGYADMSVGNGSRDDLLAYCGALESDLARERRRTVAMREVIRAAMDAGNGWVVGHSSVHYALSEMRRILYLATKEVLADDAPGRPGGEGESKDAK